MASLDEELRAYWSNPKNQARHIAEQMDERNKEIERNAIADIIATLLKAGVANDYVGQAREVATQIYQAIKSGSIRNVRIDTGNRDDRRRTSQAT